MFKLGMGESHLLLNVVSIQARSVKYNEMEEGGCIVVLIGNLVVVVI